MQQKQNRHINWKNHKSTARTKINASIRPEIVTYSKLGHMLPPGLASDHQSTSPRRIQST